MKLLTKNLEKIGDVHWHLFNSGVVELLNVLESSLVLLGDEVDGSTLTTESTTSTDTMDVVFSVGGEIVVDDEGDLLDI